MTQLVPPERCIDPTLNEALPSFCFGELSADQRNAIALHVVECDTCWQELERLESVVRAVRFDPRLASLPVTAETVAVVKLSGKMEQTFAGRFGFAMLASGLHAALYTASIWTELGYAADRFGRLALTLSPLVFTTILLGTLGALWVSARAVTHRRYHGLVASLGVLLAVVAVLLAGLSLVLPDEPTIKATFATRSAFNGYLKNAMMYFFPVAVMYVLLPFQAVVGLQRELHEGRVSNTLALLSGDRGSFHPQGVWYIRPLVLGLLILPAAWIGYQGTHHLLDALVPGPYANLFTAALHIRVGLWFALALLGFGWYLRATNDLKQQALLMKRLADQGTH